jgi:hypothetical protein
MNYSGFQRACHSVISKYVEYAVNCIPNTGRYINAVRNSTEIVSAPNEKNNLRKI